MRRVFLLLVIIAAADAQIHDPAEMPCNCTVSGDPVVSTYDGAILLIIREQKTLISRWEADQSDSCKFQLRAMTQKEIGGVNGSVYIEWIGLGFDVNPTATKKRGRNILIGQNTSHIYLRGHGFDGAQLQPLPYTYAENGLYIHVGEENGKIQVRSSSCEFALDFFPDNRDTRFNFYVGNQYRDNTMLGMCGNCNGVSSDDFRTCPNKTHPAAITNSDNKFYEISDSCKEGKHQGFGYKGGNKI